MEKVRAAEKEREKGEMKANGESESRAEREREREGEGVGKTKMGVNECATCNAAGDMEVASVTNGADLRKHVRRRDPLALLLPLSERLHYILFLRRKNASILPQSCAVQEI
jgi:hypothetical protein